MKHYILLLGLSVFLAGCETTEKAPTGTRAKAIEQTDDRVYLGGEIDKKPIAKMNTWPSVKLPNGIDKLKAKLQVTIERNGSVSSVEVLEIDLPGYSEKFIEEVKKMRFVPGEKNGEKVRSIMTLTVGSVQR